MRVQVDRVNIPAMSTLGYGWGTVVGTDRRVQFAGDHRPMRDLGEALREGEPVEVDVEAYQIIGEEHT